MNLDVYNTHMELYPYVKGDYPIIEKQYTATDKFTGNDFPCGYMIEDGKLYLPKGTSISWVESLTGATINDKFDSDPMDEMTKKHYSLYDPRNKIQEESIAFLKENNHQGALNLQTGGGKTFCVAYAASDLMIKTIIITPNESLKLQWLNTFSKMFEYKTKNLMNIAGSNIINGIMDDLIEYEDTDVFFVNHQTLQSYITNNNGFMLHKFFKKIKVGIKVYDESHMNFANIINIDSFTNTDRTWYLTATFDRSDKSESKCFKRAFNSVISYGEIESKEIMRKHVIYHIIDINSRVTPKNRAKVIGYTGFTSISYGKYAFFEDPNDTAYKTILELLKKTKDTEGKTLVFVPLIDAVDEVVIKLKKDFLDKSVGAYHSKISKDEKESSLKKDIIVSTIKSCGTGKDIPGLRCVICAEPIASKIIAQQLMGRLRPYADDKDTYFFDIKDVSFNVNTWWWNSRMKVYQDLAKKVVYLNID